MFEVKYDDVRDLRLGNLNKVVERSLVLDNLKPWFTFSSLLVVFCIAEILQKQMMSKFTKELNYISQMYVSMPAAHNISY